MDTFVGLDSAWTDNSKAPGAIAALCFGDQGQCFFHLNRARGPKMPDKQMTAVRIAFAMLVGCLLTVLVDTPCALAGDDSLHDAAVDFLTTHLRCPDDTPPNNVEISSAPFLHYLIQAGYLDVRHRDFQDSTSCWNLRHIFMADGLPIYAVCAATEEDLVMLQNPRLYVREPGTMVQTFAVFANVPTNIATAWVAKNVDVANPSELPLIADPKDDWRLAFTPKTGTAILCAN